MELQLVIMELASASATSITMASLYRLFAVYGKYHHMAETRVLLLLVTAGLLYPLPIIGAGAVVGYYVVEQQSAISENVLTHYPKLASTIQTHLCAFIDPGLPYFQLGVLLATVQMGLIIAAGLGIWLMALVRLARARAELSKRTYQLHKQLIIALAMQFALPAVVFALPFALVDFALLNGGQFRKESALKNYL